MASPARQITGEHDTACLQIDYQADVDLLFASIGMPEPARNVEVEPGIYVRVAPAGNRVLGIEIIDCASRFQVDASAVDLDFVEQKLKEFGPIALTKAQS